MNDERPKLHALLTRKDFDILLVEYKERLSRFGFRWFETLCPFRIEVINVAETLRNDLMEDLVAIVTSFTADPCRHQSLTGAHAMRTAHRKSPVMRRASRLFLNDVNAGKAAVVRDFLHHQGHTP